ncbi:ATP-binding protein [Christiangramia fulva]|uniref:histidine kinase n=1 Tax=Christiangramia fulva TaxID=2126553 RepID=A0A2R3Z9V1_9FLAO|nr:tetratricopeptide repeat-containing sensor histidine kinase [Christiangramia fulva]AVR47073.1 ATP-binding protein [Christiangramia fulva]
MISKRLIAPLLLCLFLLSCGNKKESEIQIKPDSAEFYYQKGLIGSKPSEMLQDFNKGLALAAPGDSIRLFLLDGKIYSFNRLKAYDSSLVYSDTLINSAKKQADSSFIAKGYYRKATVNRYLNRQEEVYRNAFSSRNIYLKLGDSSKAGRRTLEMANAQHRMADYTGSQQTATTALELLSKEKDSAYVSSAFNVIAMSYRDRGFRQDALKEYQNALRFSQNTRDSLPYLNNIALVYQDLGDYEKAIAGLEAVLEKADVADADSKARYIDNYAYTRWLADPSVNILDDLKKAMNMRLQENDLDGLFSSYEHLSEYYESTNPKLAREYALKSMETAKAGAGKNSELQALKRLINLFPPEESKAFTNRFIALNDSLQQSKLQSANLFAKIDFDEKKKREEIQNLETRTKEQAIETANLKNQMIILSLGSLLIFSLGSFILYYFRQKNKREKIQTVHQTETRISKRIHDELANDLYNIMSRMEPIAPAEILDNLENIYIRTRNISRENASINTGAGYRDNLISTLSGICPENTRLIIRGEDTIDWNAVKEEKKLVIFRVLQEVMVNMKKHSRASLVAIIFSRKNRFLEISYSDNGIGCTEKSIKNGNGIQNVENRIFSLHGSITFETEKGKGVKISIKIPV